MRAKGFRKCISMSHLPSTAFGSCRDKERFCESRALDKVGELICLCRLPNVDLKEPNLVGSKGSSSVSIASGLEVRGIYPFKGTPGKDEGKEVR